MKKYSPKVPKIYYDEKFQCYVNPIKIHEYGCLEYVCSEITWSGLYYTYNLNGRKTHGHTIGEAFLSAYNDAEIFSIPEESKTQYSKQELEFIKKLVTQGKLDRQSK